MYFKRLLLLVFIAAALACCNKANVGTSYYTIVAGSGLQELGAPTPHFNLTGDYIQSQNNLTGSYIYGVDLPKGKSITLTAAITAGNPYVFLYVYKTNVQSTENEVKKVTGQGSVSVTFTVE